MKHPIFIMSVIIPVLFLLAPSVRAEECTSVQNDVRAEASTGGNDAGDETVITGNANARATVSTTINGDTVSSIDRGAHSEDGNAEISVSVNTSVSDGVSESNVNISVNGSVSTDDEVKPDRSGEIEPSDEKSVATENPGDAATQEHFSVVNFIKDIMHNLSSWFSDLFSKMGIAQ